MILFPTYADLFQVILLWFISKVHIKAGEWDDIMLLSIAPGAVCSEELSMRETQGF